MIVRGLLAVVAALAVALGVQTLRTTWQGNTIDAQAAEIVSQGRSIASLTSRAEQSAQAREVDAARAAGEMKRAAESAETITAILTAELEECADAPLDPDLCAVLGELCRTAD